MGAKKLLRVSSSSGKSRVGRMLIAACALLVVAVFAFMPATAWAADDLEAPSHVKTVSETPDENGYYTVSLDVTGNTTGGTTTETTPLDIVLVLDVSGSMDNNIGGWNSGSKLAALKTAVNSFIDQTEAANAGITDPASQHRISLVKFASDKRDSIGNDKTWQGYNYSQRVITLNSSDATNASTLKSTVNSLTAAGATSADYGMQLAQTELNDNGRSNAKKVVIFFTDGEPNHQSGFDGSVANAAISASKSLKDSGVTVYSIGVFSDANPSDTSNRFNAYMNGVSSNYPNATAYSPTNRLGSRANGNHYFAATNAAELEKVFEDISSEITTSVKYQGVRIEDALSSSGWVEYAEVTGGQPTFVYKKNGVVYTPNTALGEQAATVDGSGKITWYPMGTSGRLDGTTTYTLEFKVKATQKAYDAAVADVDTGAPHQDVANETSINNFYTNNNDVAKVYYSTVISVTGEQDTIVSHDPVSYNKPTITLPTSTVTVSKVWQDSAGNPLTEGLPESVQVQLKQDDATYGEAVTLNAGNNWTADISVPAGPEGHTYTAEETVSDDWETTVAASGANQSVLTLVGLTAQTGSFTVTNKPATGGLAITKTVEVGTDLTSTGITTAPDVDFTFEVQLSGQTTNASYVIGDAEPVSVSFDANGTATVTLKLKGGQTALFSGLKKNTTYQVSEADVRSDFSQTSPAADPTGTIVGGQTAEADFTNTYNGYQLVIIKQDSDETALKNAEFTLTNVTEGTTQNALVSTPSDENGHAQITGIVAPGTYTLKETKVPAGYQILQGEYTVTVDADGNMTLASQATGDTHVQVGEVTFEDGVFKITITNDRVADLPQTGGMGNVPLYVAGAALIVGAIVLVDRRRREL